MQFDAAMAGALAVAVLAGTAVGIERERSGHTIGPQARFAGARTFFLIGGMGGLAGWLITVGQPAPALVLLASCALLIVTAYILAARQGGEAIDGTTEMAALVTLALGMIAGMGQPLITSGCTAIMLIVLAEKTRIHQAIRRVGELELASALRFAVLALVVLPLLPAGPYGPGGLVHPRTLWTVVLIFSAINFAAFLAIRTLGVHRGYGLSGLLGGLISSTAVTLQFSRKSRHTPRLGTPLALGVTGACVVLILRIETLTTLLNPSLALALLPYLLPPLVLGGALLLSLYRRDPHTSPAEDEPPVQNPLGLRSSLLMVLAFQAAILVIGGVQQWLGASGIIVSAAALGLTDMDALTYAMSRVGSDPGMTALAAKGIAVGMIANTALKGTVAVTMGRGPFRLVALTSFMLLLLGSLLGLWLAAALPLS